MTTSADVNVTFLAVMARISDVPVSKTLIEKISDDEWVDTCDSNWMINAGTDVSGCSDELDESDEITVRFA